MKMGSNNEFKEIDNRNRAFCYFDDIIDVNDIDLHNILINEKSYEIFLIHVVAYKTPYGSKPLRIIFDNVDEYIRKYDSTKYVALFYSDEKYEKVFDRIRYLIMLKRNISDVYSHKYTKIKMNSDDDLPLEKPLNMHNVVILIKFVFNKNYNRNYYQVFFRKMLI